ncbi:MAG: hypothetical protein M0Z98_05210, partial [Actinomycetales bacterium]|nr:hypothetical protein [Actinomycetales bacterium]
PVSGLFTAAEKVSYTSAITGNFIVNGGEGNDHIALDDNSAVTTINGGNGSDRFSVGQLYTSYVKDSTFGIPAAQFFHSTRGDLSNGVSFATTINGGSGDDSFDIFHNLAVLSLNGDAGDDTFIIRSFASESETSRVNTGEGRDYVEYAMNAPVSIDGGTGFDTVVVIGTEFNDKYVITKDAVYGAGRYVTYTNIERLKVYGMEGDDTFYVPSTNPDVETSIFGGLGNDHVEVGAAAPAVQSNDLLGHTGLIRHSVEATGGLSSDWTGIPVDGVAAEIVDNDAPAFVIVPVGGPTTVVSESSGAAVQRQISIRPTFGPDTTVYVTLSAPVLPSDPSRTTYVQLSTDGVHWKASATLVFAATSTTAQTLYVRAAFDLLPEGTQAAQLQTSVVGAISGTVTSATTNTLTATGAFAGRSLAGLTVRILSGAGVDQELVISGSTADTLTLASAWATLPDATSTWQILNVGRYDRLAVNNSVVTIVDDEAAAVVVTPPTGGTTVVEQDSTGSHGTTATFTIRLPRAPYAGGTVTLHVVAPAGLQIRLVGTTSWSSTLDVGFTSATTLTIEVQAPDNGVIEGQQFLSLTTTITSSDRITGTVVGTTGRDDEFTFGDSALTANSLVGYQVRILSGAGAGQVRWVLGNVVDGGVNVLQVSSDFDVLPDSTSTFEVFGYQAPVTTAQVGGNVTAITDDRLTLTVDGTLPTADGGLSGALVRVVGKTGAMYYRYVASNTSSSITVTEAWGFEDGGVTPVIVAGKAEVVVVGVPGLLVDPVRVLVQDSDTPGVVITQSDGTTRLVEGATAGEYEATDAYTVRLTRDPGLTTVTVTLRPLMTPSLDLRQVGTDCTSVAGGCNLVQVRFVAGTGQTVDTDGSLVLTFTSANWFTEQTVTVAAIDDTVVDGSDLQEFADSARRVTQIQGPLTVSGGDDPSPPVPLTLDGYLPVVLPGESSDHPRAAGASTALALETAQVDTLVVHNEDSPAADTGSLTTDPITGEDQVTGLGMSTGTVLSGVPFSGGILYADFEDLTVLLGYGNDTFTIVNTHDGTTTIDAGKGDDTVTVRTLSGHTRILGQAGDDTFRVGSTAHLLDELAALLVIDGGSGADTAWLDDAGDTNDNLGTLTQTTLTGLDMVARTALDDLGRPLDRLYSVTPATGAAEFTIALSVLIDGLTTGLGAVTFAVGASAAAVQAALQQLLFPRTNALTFPYVSNRCGIDDSTACAPTVYVWQVGGRYLVGFRGEVNEDPAHPVLVGLTALGVGGVAVDLTRRDGIDYAGVETLNLSLGSGSDVLNVQGTSAQTNVSLASGDDRVYVASLANVGLTDRPEFLPGGLDGIDGTLNLDLGSGRNTLQISDEASSTGDPRVLMTDVRSAAWVRDEAVTAAEAIFGSPQEIYLVGLAQGSITWRTASDGNLADGIRIWSGSGADTFVVDGTHNRAGLRTTTWLNTGLGNDDVTVNLTNGQDGFFVLNTQGPVDNVLQLSTVLSDGDAPVQSSAVSVTVNGAALDPTRYVVHNHLDTVGLFDSLTPGDVVVVTVDHRVVTTYRSSGAQTVDLEGALGSGESVRVLVNGVEICGPSSTLCSVSGSMLTFDAGTSHDLADLTADDGSSYIVVEVTRRTTQSFAAPQLGATDDDTVDGRLSTLPLVIFGGQGSDKIDGGTGGDIVLGDRGRVLWFTPGSIPAIAGIGTSEITPELLAQLEGLAVAVSGNGGFGDKTDGVERLVGLVVTTDPTIGGDDTITTGSGSDIVLAGAGGDSVTTNRGSGADLTDLVLGDHGFIDWVTLDGDPTDLDRIWSTDTALGGDDTITTGLGDDVVFGGTGADGIVAGDGLNIVLGDSGRFDAFPAVTSRWGQLPMSAGVLQTISPSVGGIDRITTGSGVDVVLGGWAGDVIDLGGAADLALGDNGKVTWDVRADALQVVRAEITDNALGGDDTVYGRGGDDLLIGGTGSDSIDGGTERDLILGDNAVVDRSTTFGDHRSPRFRTLAAGATQIYSTDLTIAGTANVDAGWQLDPAHAAAWTDFRITLLDHEISTSSDRYGNDYLAGGAGDDTIFGQLGNDTIQGDGSIDHVAQQVDPLTGAPVTGGATGRVGAHRNSAGDLVLLPSFEAPTDGSDYIEGGGGSDVVFGGLGADDIIGGSSDLFSLDATGADGIAQRTDGGDLLFGGAGTRAARSDLTAGHGRDSDTIVGDNGRILRLVTVTNATTGATAYLSFAYATQYAETTAPLVPHAVVLLDYTSGGPDAHPDLFTGMTQSASVGSGTAAVDVWGSDEVHGESGDDTVYAGGGNDVVYGDAGDDDLVGGWGADWISGGAGTDGILGDDGRIFTSRNGLTEPLNGVTVATVQSTISTPGQIQTAVINATGLLTKSVDLTPWALNPITSTLTAGDPLFDAQYADDLLFGGLGDDFVHGGGGNDGISGSEALATSYAPVFTGSVITGVVESGWLRPLAFHGILGYGTLRVGTFALYDEYDPRRMITLAVNGTFNAVPDPTRPWLLNNDTNDGLTQPLSTKLSDGNDVLFGDYGNDWLVGGTGRDTLWGGWGNDLLNGDDDLTTNTNLNDVPDTEPSYEDRAFGGAGLDVLIGNTGGDRLIDWVGEFNSYLVPFSPFGIGTVSRQVLPGLPEFLYALSKSQ